MPMKLSIQKQDNYNRIDILRGTLAKLNLINFLLRLKILELGTWKPPEHNKRTIVTKLSLSTNKLTLIRNLCFILLSCTLENQKSAEKYRIQNGKNNYI